MTRLGHVALLLAVLGLPALAQGPDVASTVHNLSVSGPGEFRSLDETEICRFCHVPHTAVVKEPLWGHALSKVARYKTPRLSVAGGRGPQPDGSSRLCLSCHDGTVAVADLGSRSSQLRMQGANRIDSARRGFIGTDLSGSHPVSVAMRDTPNPDRTTEMGLRPTALVEADSEVRLDPDGKVQCTSCHDPHSDRYFGTEGVPHFFVKPTVTEACLVCHELR